jgi:hypothetical protein
LQIGQAHRSHSHGRLQTPHEPGDAIGEVLKLQRNAHPALKHATP